ncbi:MAG: protein kinase [Gemmatimonadaceae bacterium]
MRDRVIAAVGDVYDIQEQLGRGGMSVVYRAVDVRLRRDVAIKVLPPDLAYRADVRTRFQREAETAARLNHPNIVPILSVDERGGLVFIVMVLVEGESLGARLAREKRLSATDTARILRDVASALAYAHSHGVVHRDIKPDNILIEHRTGRSVVTDFGIARALDADTRLTVTGIAVGTPAYMSPEQALGERDVDGRSDIYSLGVVAYQMLAGEVPFAGRNTTALLLRHLNEIPRSLRSSRVDLPPGLVNAIERALAKRREDRWQNAADFGSAIAAALTVSSALPAMLPRVPEPRGHPEPVQPWEHWRADERSRRREAAPISPMPAAAPASHKAPIDERIVGFRRNLAGSGATVLTLAAINALTTPFFPWFLFPSVVMGGRLFRRWGGLWAEGVTWKEILQPGARNVKRTPRSSASVLPSQALSQETITAGLAPPEVIAGPHGASIRRVVAERAAIAAIVESLENADRAMLPDIAPTVDALVERTASLAQMLHNLDASVSPDTLREIETRIASARSSRTPVGDASRIELLERQRATLADLTTRRQTTAARLERTATALETLKLDLIKLRSQGMQSALDDSSDATREARAVQREIELAIETAEELRESGDR